jgi:hypothetical protein
VVTAEDASILPSLTGTSGVLTGTGTAAAAIDVFAAAVAAQEALNGSAPRAIVVLYRRSGVNRPLVGHEVPAVGTRCPR